MDLISRACGYLACCLKEFDDALYWYEKTLALRQKLDDYRHIPDSWATIGHVAVQSGNAERARYAFFEGLTIANTIGQHSLIGCLSAAIHEVEKAPLPNGLDVNSDFCGIRIERPKSKLTSPFGLAHLSSEPAFVPAVHQSLLGAAYGEII
jgi:hypothetical protein